MGQNQYLEQQLGKVSGQLEALAPALDKMDDRLRQAETRAAGSEARFEALRKEFDEYKIKVTNRIGTLFNKAENLAKGDAESKNVAKEIVEAEKNALEAKTAATAAQTMAAEAKRISEELRTERKGWGKKIWDVVKMVLAALISAYITMKLTGKP